MFLAFSLFNKEDKNFFRNIKFPFVDPDTAKSPLSLTKSHFDHRPNELNNLLLESWIDYLVIGSGPSGLTTAVLLAMDGKKVMVVDSHPERLGGTCHSFKRRQYQFQPASHVITGLSSDATFDPLRKNNEEDLKNNVSTPHLTRKLINFLTQNSLQLHPTTTEVITGNPKRKRRKKKFTFSDMSSSLRSMFVRYPSEVTNIKKFFSIVEEIANRMEKITHGFIELPVQQSRINILKPTVRGSPKKDGIMDKYNDMSFQDVLYEMFRHPEVRDLLYGMVLGSGQFTPYKILQLPFTFIATCLYQTLRNGLYFCTGGMERVGVGLLNSLQKFEGYAFCGVEVTKIMTEDVSGGGGRKAIGVMLSDGGRIFCKNIISSLGIRPTRALLPEVHRVPRNLYEKKLFGISGIKKKKKTTDYFVVYLGIEGRAEELGLMNGRVTVIFPKWEKSSANTPTTTPVVIKGRARTSVGSAGRRMGMGGPPSSISSKSRRRSSNRSSPSQVSPNTSNESIQSRRKSSQQQQKPSPQGKRKIRRGGSRTPSTVSSKISHRRSPSSLSTISARSNSSTMSTRSSLTGPREEVFQGPFVIYCENGTDDTLEESDNDTSPMNTSMDSSNDLDDEHSGTSITLVMQIQSRLFSRFKVDGGFKNDPRAYAKYNRRKKQLTRIALEKFLLYYPKAKDVRVYESATSRTMCSFMGKYRYNQLELDADRFDFHPPFSKLENFYVTGNDTVPITGVHGSVLSGLITAQKILKLNLLEDLMDYEQEN